MHSTSINRTALFTLPSVSALTAIPSISFDDIVAHTE